MIFEENYTPYEVIPDPIEGFGIQAKVNRADPEREKLRQQELQKRKAEWKQRRNGDRRIVIDPDRPNNPAGTDTGIDTSRTLAPVSANKALTASEKKSFSDQIRAAADKAKAYAQKHPIRTIAGIAVAGGVLYYIFKEDKPARSLSGLPGRRKNSKGKGSNRGKGAKPAKKRVR